jgi:hypothetical protein
MKLLGDVGHVEPRFGPFGDSVSVGAWFALNLPQAWKSFWTHKVELLSDVGHVEPHFGLFGDCVNIGPFGDSANLDTR